MPVTPDASRYTFDDAAQAVTDNYIAKGRKTLKDTQRRIDNHLKPPFGGMRLAGITADVIEAFIATRLRAGASNSEINRELAVLKRTFTLASRARKVFTGPHIEMLREPPPRSSFFEYPDFVKVP